MNIETKNMQLNPKSYKDFYNEIAKECEVHPDLVDELVRFFYNEIRKNMESLEFTRIRVPNFGTFITRKERLNRAIKRHKDMLGNLEKRTFTGYNAHLPIKEKLELMNKAAERIKNELQLKKDWKNEHS
jgi:nucleoid DNA-binding protein